MSACGTPPLSSGIDSRGKKVKIVTPIQGLLVEHRHQAVGLDEESNRVKIESLSLILLGSPPTKQATARSTLRDRETPRRPWGSNRVKIESLSLTLLGSPPTKQATATESKWKDIESTT